MKDEQAPSRACQELAGLKKAKREKGKRSDTFLDWLTGDSECRVRAREINQPIINVTVQILRCGMRTWHYYVQLKPHYV